jgi:23S rRNA pseudouridine2605 synthase
LRRQKTRPTSMPRKSKKNTEPEVAETQAPETGAAAAVPESESDLPVRKTVRKKRASKVAAEGLEEPVTEIPPADAVVPEVEMMAQAADTFDAASEANDAHELNAATAETEEKPKKVKRAKKAVVKAEAKAEALVETPKPEPQPDGNPDDLGPEEDDEDDDEGEVEHEVVPMPPPKLERLQKILAAAGIASRRHAEELITEGRVQVNGKVVTELGSKADAGRDHIRVDGKLLHGAERQRYFVLNKPRGYVTTVSDPEGRPTVMEFFAKTGERVYPVGRLDYLSEGLLLMTNDGDLANKLTRAASGVEKTYLVKVSGQPDEEKIESLREGVSIDRGRPGEGRVRTAPARIQRVRAGENPWFEVTLIEGRNRELRKMFEEIGHYVEKIRRVGYGPLVLDLEPGQLRELDEQELNLLRLAADGKWKPKRVKAVTMLPKEAGRSVDHEAAKRGPKPFGDKRRPGQGYQDRGRSGERPVYGRSGDRPRGPAPGGARPAFDRPRPATGGPGRGFAAGSRPAAQERRPGGWQARGVDGGPGQGQVRGPVRGPERGQDRGVRPEQTGDRARGPVRGPVGGQTRDQGRDFRRDDRGGFGGQGRIQARAPGPVQDRGQQRGPNRPGGTGGFSRPQGQRFGGNKPFRAKPEFQSERPRRAPDSEERPPRPVKLHIEEAGPARPESRPREDFRRERAGEARPAAPGRGEQRFGNRPPRPPQRAQGGGFRPAGGRGERPGETRGFTARPDRRPPRPEGGGASSAPRPGPRPEARGGSGVNRDQGGGRSRFGSGARGGSASGPRPGNRPGGRGGAGSSGARSGGYGRTPRRPR